MTKLRAPPNLRVLRFHLGRRIERRRGTCFASWANKAMGHMDDFTFAVNAVFQHPNFQRLVDDLGNNHGGELHDIATDAGSSQSLKRKRDED